MKDFAMFKMTKVFYERWGIPEVPLPVPVDELPQLAEREDMEFPELLYWIQEYSKHSRDEWIDLEGVMVRLAELLAPQDDRETVPVEGDTWFFQLSPVDLGGEIVTIQRQDKLIAAMQPLEDGRLKVGVYRPLDAKTCKYLISLSVKGDPEYGVNMRKNNWEYALDNSATMGNAYASERGESYLSYWQYGIGLDSSKNPIPDWIDMQSLKPIPPNLTATQLGIWYLYKPEDV